MNTKLAKLVADCRGEVSVTFNQHRMSYHSVAAEILNLRGSKFEIDTEIAMHMIDRGAMVAVHFYPDTPIGFFIVHHYDLELALDRALELLAEDRK